MLTEEQLSAISGERILILEWSSGAPHFERSLELFDRLYGQNQVFYKGPWSFGVTENQLHENVFFRAYGKFKNRKRFNLAKGYEKKGFDQAISGTLSIPHPEIDALVGSLSIDQLRELKYEGFDVGEALLSSLVSLQEDAHVKLSGHEGFVRALCRSVLKIFINLKDLLSTEIVDTVVLYNGRFATSRAIRVACEQTSKDYLVHECSFGSMARFSVFKNATPHKIESWGGWVDDWWEYFKNPEVIGRSFFEKQRKEQGGVKYNRKQKSGFIDRNIPKEKKLVVFFNSSDDEFMLISEYAPADSSLCDQVSAVREVKRVCEEKGYSFILRMHPRLAQLRGNQQYPYHEFEDCIIPSESAVDTYALMMRADVVLAHRSTVAAEAAYYGKPSLLTGRSLYEDCVPRCLSTAELEMMLAQPPQPDRLRALKYGAFLGGSGIAYHHYEPLGVTEGLWKGCNLDK